MTRHLCSCYGGQDHVAFCDRDVLGVAERCEFCVEMCPEVPAQRAPQEPALSR